MVTVNIQEAKTHLSSFLDRVEQGEVIILCRHNKPIATIKALPQKPSPERQFGLFDGHGVPASFFEPLDEAVLQAFSGQ